jgi:RNA polymerase sigma-70 factor (ECF subfamily)
VLRKDAALEPVGSLTWFSGRDTCMRYVRQFFGAPGDWLMTATAANGQPAAAAYLRGPDGVHRAFGLAVLTVTGTGIARIVVFGDPGLVTRFGFPPVHDGRGTRR